MRLVHLIHVHPCKHKHRHRHRETYIHARQFSGCRDYFMLTVNLWFLGKQGIVKDVTAINVRIELQSDCRQVTVNRQSVKVLIKNGIMYKLSYLLNAIDIYLTYIQLKMWQWTSIHSGKANSCPARTRWVPVLGYVLKCNTFFLCNNDEIINGFFFFLKLHHSCNSHWLLHIHLSFVFGNDSLAHLSLV